ncbi:MAG: insulinase family protein [Angelakisella sp.]
MSSDNLTRVQLCPSVSFSSVRDKKFRHNSISVNLIVPLERDKAAATAILPYLLRKGSRHYPDFTLLEQQLCELYGASLSSDVVKYGDRQIVSASISFVDDRFTLDGEVISDRCADLLGDMVLAPKLENGVFDAADFVLEQQNLIDTIQAEINDKRSYAITQCREMMFAGSPLAVSKYGTVEQAKALTSGEAAARYAELLDTAVIEIMFVGCGDPAPAREKFRQLFAAQNRHPLPLVDCVPPSPAAAPRTQEKRLEVAQAKLVLGMRVTGASSKSEVDAVKLMTTLYGGTPNSRLFLNVREKLSLCYYCAARYDRPTGSILVDIGVEHKNREQAQKAILEQLEVMKAGGFTSDELAETKLAAANGMRSVADSLSAIESWYLVQIMEGTDHSPEDEVNALAGISAEAVSAAAAKVTLDSVYFLTGLEAPHEE